MNIFSAKEPYNSGSFAERDLQVTASYASSPPCGVSFPVGFKFILCLVCIQEQFFSTGGFGGLHHLMRASDPRTDPSYGVRGFDYEVAEISPGTYTPPKETGAVRKETYIIPKETYSTPQETYFIPKETNVIQKEMYTNSKETYANSKETYSAPRAVAGGGGEWVMIVLEGMFSAVQKDDVLADGLQQQLQVQIAVALRAPATAITVFCVCVSVCVCASVWVYIYIYVGLMYV